MQEAAEFQELIGCVRAGDPEAAAEFVRLYEPAIRRAARIRIVDPRLAPLFDSVDIAQSVFASFFVRAALGQYELGNPQQALSLLVSMSRKKLADRARKEGAARRDYRRINANANACAQLAAVGADPCQLALTQELIQEFRKRLTPEERELAELRAVGQNWADIANVRGASAEALRKQLGRAVNRVALDLGLNEVGDA